MINIRYMSSSGGLMLYIRNDLVQRRRSDLECDVLSERGRVESLCVELYIRSEKWIICSIYKQPTMKVTDFCQIFEIFLSNLASECLNYIVIGDLNIDMLKPPEPFINLLGVSGCRNVATQPTYVERVNICLLLI